MVKERYFAIEEKKNLFKKNNLLQKKSEDNYELYLKLDSRLNLKIGSRHQKIK